MQPMRKQQAALMIAVALGMAGTAVAQSPTSTYYPPTGTTAPVVVNAPQNNVYPANGSNYGQSTMTGRVTRVDPVFDASIASRTGQRRCYNQRTGQYTIESANPQSNDPYNNNGDYYGDRNYGRDPRYPNEPVQRGSTAGNVISSILGGVVGGVIGSKIGGGTGSIIASSVGSSIGTMAGQRIYRNSQMPQGTTTVCEPLPSNDSRQYNAYDVQYQIGNQYGTVRTTQSYRVGDSITVNVSAQ